MAAIDERRQQTPRAGMLFATGLITGEAMIGTLLYRAAVRR